MGHPERRARRHRAIHFADQRSTHGIRESAGVIFTTIQKFSRAAARAGFLQTTRCAGAPHHDRGDALVGLKPGDR